MCKKNNISGQKIISNLITVLILVVCIVFCFNFKFVKIDGESMYPHYYDGQYVLIDKDFENLEYNDIIVFKIDDGYAVKRIVAVADDTVSLSNKSVYINGVKFSPYTYNGRIDKNYQLTPNNYFVIGDNHLVSYDSRDYGPINKSQIIGKVVIEL